VQSRIAVREEDLSVFIKQTESEEQKESFWGSNRWSTFGRCRRTALSSWEEGPYFCDSMCVLNSQWKVSEILTATPRYYRYISWNNFWNLFILRV